MRALHFVKTADGAAWAAQQCRELVSHGAEIHVALPRLEGRSMAGWRSSGAELHQLEVDWPARAPWRIPSLAHGLRNLIDHVRPDLLQTYHVGPTLLLRHALGKKHPLPRVFWVAGPLHLEHFAFRAWELACAGPQDRWICTSRCIQDKYRQAGISPERLFVSYAGSDLEGYATQRSGRLREALGIAPDKLVVGNISYIYGPKYHLGQTTGLKCHEDLIDALNIVTRRRTDVVGVLAGGAWGNAKWYERRLRRQAQEAGEGRVLMPGYLPPGDIQRIWPDFDLAVHVPLSENCGGALEPLLSGVPVIAGDVGGLPELVLDGTTGRLVPIRKPAVLADRVLEVLENLEAERRLAAHGRALVRCMFDVRRTALEVLAVYRHILQGAERPPSFDSRQFAEALA